MGRRETRRRAPGGCATDASSHTSQPAPLGGTLLRLARFARPYLGLLLLSIFASSVYTGARALRAYLLKPLVDDVAMAGSASTEVARKPDWFGRLIGLETGADAGSEVESAAEDSAAGESAAAESESEARARLARQVRENFWNVILAALAIITVIPIAHFASLYLVEYVLGRVRVDIQQELCGKLLELPLGFHDRMSRGERLSRTTNDAIHAHGALKLLFGDVITSVLALVIGSVLLFTISWQLTLCIAVVAPFVAGIIAIFGRRIRLRAERRQQSVGDVTQRLVEILSGIKVIKAFRAQAVESASFRRENVQLFRRSMSVVLNRAAARTLVEGLNNFVAVAVLVGGATAVWLGLWGLTVGSLGAFVLVLATTYRPVKDLAKGWAQLMDAIPAAERFFELLDTRAELPDAPDAVPLRGPQQSIRVAGVCFSYGREPVLRDVSFEAKAGEVVAIVGRTGAGKTTLADLLLRFYDPDAGAIEIDGVDLRRIQRDSLQDRVAVVSQEPFLFAGSIRDNIRYGRPGASDAEVAAAAAAAHVDEFVRELPEGYDTEVGEAGAHLSGGQRQRVTIARALLKDPAILIFDEATSSLDARSERYIQDALATLLQGRTTFVIAHRLSTIRHADRIVVLEEGRVAAVGSHAELMARGGLYADLVAIQERPDAPSGA